MRNDWNSPSDRKMWRNKTNEEGDEDEKVFSDNERHKMYSSQMRINAPNRSSGTKGKEIRQFSMNFVRVLAIHRMQHHVAIIKKVTKSTAIPICDDTSAPITVAPLNCMAPPQCLYESWKYSHLFGVFRSFFLLVLFCIDGKYTRWQSRIKECLWFV